MNLESEKLTGKIIECAIAVHKELGPGFLESIYQTAFNDNHLAQLLSYLKASGLKVELLLNFAKAVLSIKRVMN